MQENKVGIIPSKDGAVRKEQRKPYKTRPNGTYQWWSDAAKVAAVKTYIILGNLAATSQVTQVPYDTLRRWHVSDWWTEIEDNLKAEENFELSASLRLRINKSLEVTMDRLEKGDFIYDAREGKMIRKPVSLRDANRAMVDMVKIKLDVDQAPIENQNKQAVIDTLAKLTEEFARMAKSKKQPTLLMSSGEPAATIKDQPGNEGERPS